MEFDDFDCRRRYIEAVYREEQKNLLIHLYCGEQYNYVNMVDFYYRNTTENAILMFLFICILFPILFMYVAEVADKYLAIGMQDLSVKFNLSPTLAAMTLIAFANGAPDVLSAFSSVGDSDGIQIALASLLGGFVFSSCLVITNVFFTVKDTLKVPKYAILKELFFYLFSLIVLIVFTFIGYVNIIFVICYLTIYGIYIFLSFKAEKMDNQLSEKANKELDMELQDS